MGCVASYMDMTDPSRFHRIWQGWRKEIIRGLVLFTVVVFVGLAATRMFGVIPFHIGDHGFDLGDLELGNRTWTEDFRWAGTIAPDQAVWIRNLNGPVTVEPAAGDSLVVTAEKSWRRSSPESVRIVAVPHAGSVTVCALWEGDQSTCGENGTYSVKDVRNNDVAVRFTVRLPRGVKVDASTVNGSLVVNDASAPVTLETVNGKIAVATAQGPVRAITKNGSIEATIQALGASGDVVLKTINGSISVALPPDLNADLDAQTMTGRVNTDFPLQVVGRISQRHVRAKIGAGGRQLTLRTEIGRASCREAGARVETAPGAAPPRPPRPNRRPSATTTVQPR